MSRIYVKDCSFRSEEGIFLNLLIFCFRYESVCPSVYTNDACKLALNKSVLKLKDGKQTFSHAER